MSTLLHVSIDAEDLHRERQRQVFLNHGEKTACWFFFAVSIHDRWFDQFFEPNLAE
jgi:hypothetical protein